MKDAIWIVAATRLPADGQGVLVKTAHGTVEHRVTFRAGPKARWESKHFISELDLYAYWRPLPPERKVPASDAHAVAR
jgi:hypothetical protein